MKLKTKLIIGGISNALACVLFPPVTVPSLIVWAIVGGQLFLKKVLLPKLLHRANKRAWPNPKSQAKPTEQKTTTRKTTKSKNKENDNVGSSNTTDAPQKKQKELDRLFTETKQESKEEQSLNDPWQQLKESYQREKKLIYGNKGITKKERLKKIEELNQKYSEKAKDLKSQSVKKVFSEMSNDNQRLVAENGSAIMSGLEKACADPNLDEKSRKFFEKTKIDTAFRVAKAREANAKNQQEEEHNKPGLNFI